MKSNSTGKPKILMVPSLARLMGLWNGNTKGNTMPHNQDGTNAGFSLLEVLIAITITGLVISIISNALMQNGRNQKVLEERVTAQILGRGKLSEIIYGSESGSAGDFAAPYQKYHWYASSETLPDGYTKILLLLEWRDGRALLHQKTLIGYSHP